MSGFFLVLEGLDGSGKSEVSRRLAAHYRTLMHERVHLSYEPHDPSAAGLYIRDVLAKAITVNPRTLALAYALNRADHTERVITPFLSSGDDRLMILDRYYLSSLVYQSAGGMSMDAIMELNSAARTPDLTLFLDASAETCYRRQGTRGKSRELFDDNLNETRDRYFRAVEYLRGRGERIGVVDANGDLLTVINGVIAAIKRDAPAWLHVEPLRELPKLPPRTNLEPSFDVFRLHFLQKPTVQWE